jgi:L-ascorbate metabolism protein UlaG (beta-lactamase superfamily)
MSKASIVFLLSILLLVLIGLYIRMGLIKTSSYKGAISDHFNGKEFFNLDKTYKKKSFADLLKWWFSRDRQQWPLVIKNTPHAVITPVDQSNIVRVTFVNHSTVLLQTKTLNFLTDPVWSLRTSPFSFIGPKRVRAPGILFADLPKIDVVMVSHNHYDHLDMQTLVKLNEKFHPIFLVPLGNKALLNNQGIQHVIEMDWWQQYKIKNATITFLPTKHWSARWLNDKNQTLWGSYGIAVEDKKIYFAGDSGYDEHFIEIKTKWGEPDLAFLPIGSYQPEWFMRDNHLNPEEAVKAHVDLQAKQSIAIHFNTFQLSDEAMDQPVKDLKTALIKRKIKKDEFVVLKEGETKDL